MARPRRRADDEVEVHLLDGQNGVTSNIPGAWQYISAQLVDRIRKHLDKKSTPRAIYGGAICIDITHTQYI